MLTHAEIWSAIDRIAAANGITVSALDANNALDATYRGTVHFTTSDHGSGVVLPADYTFLDTDNGTHTFTNGVTLVTAGAGTSRRSGNVDNSRVSHSICA